MYYFVIYKFYTEHNQFEGSWDICIEKCNTQKAAREFINILKKDGNYKDFILTKEIKL